MSNTLLEAMANRTPIVARNILGNSSLIHDSCNGLLFNSDNLNDSEHMNRSNCSLIVALAALCPLL